MQDATTRTRVREAIEAAHQARSEAFLNGISRIFRKGPRS